MTFVGKYFPDLKPARHNLWASLSAAWELGEKGARRELGLIVEEARRRNVHYQGVWVGFNVPSWRSLLVSLCRCGQTNKG